MSIGQGSVILTWNPSTDNVGVAGYCVWVDAVRWDSTEITQYKFDLEAGEYDLTVSAYDAAGNESAQSEPFPITITDITVPDIPNLMSIEYLEDVVKISWLKSTDNVGVVGYYIYVNGSRYASTTDNFYEFKNISPDSEYRISISAYDEAGNESKRTSEFNIKIPVDDLTMVIYPNPVKYGRFKILLDNGKIKDNSCIKIISIDGKILVERDLNNGVTVPHEEEFYLSNGMTAGMYVVILYTNNKKVLYSYLSIVNASVLTKYIINGVEDEDKFKEDIRKFWIFEK